MDWATAKDQINTLVTQTLGESVTYTPAVGVPVTIKGVFTRAWVLLSVGENAGTQSYRPLLTVRLLDLPSGSPTQGDQVTVETVLYNIIESQDDGGGGSTLVLQKAT